MKEDRKEALIRKYSYAAQQNQAKTAKGPGRPRKRPYARGKA